VRSAGHGVADGTPPASWVLRPFDGPLSLQPGEVFVVKKLRSVLSRRVHWLFLAPALLLLACFKLYPSIMGLYYSFTSWSGFGPVKYIGLKNYDYLFHDHDFYTVLINNAKLLIALPVFVLVPLIVAVMLWERPWGYKFLKAAYFFPAILSPVIIGGMFSGLLQVQGPVDAFVRLFVHSFNEDWLGDPRLTMWVVLAVVLWGTFGIGVLVYLAALASAPLDLFEAAKLDGAGWWRRMQHVVIPSVRNVISFWSVIVLVSLFTTLFGYIFSLTGGGPGLSSTVLEYDVYTYAFTNQQFGLAAAVGVVLLVITGTFTIIQMRLTLGKDTDHA
jgi:ABC-type sugar transport system permease subunit